MGIEGPNLRGIYEAQQAEQVKIVNLAQPIIRELTDMQMRVGFDDSKARAILQVAMGAFTYEPTNEEEIK